MILNTTNQQDQYFISRVNQGTFLKSELRKGTHDLLLTKRTEAFFGVVEFEGFMFSSAEDFLVSTSNRFKRRESRHIEFVGDSITW